MNNEWKAELPVILLREVHTDNVALNTKVFKDVMRQKSPISIPAGTKNIRFTFDLMSKTRRNGIACAYRVKELSDIWISLPYGTRNIDLNDLYPGQYTLELRLKGQKDQEKLIKVDFKLEPYLTQRVWFRALVLVLVVFVLGFSTFLLQERKHRSTRLRLIETEKKLLESKAEQLEIKSKQQQNELSFQLLKTSSRLELLKSFKERLINESEKKDRSEEVLKFLKGLTRELNRELQSENYWDHFERNYRELHESFSKRLMEHYPNLTNGEVRICYLIRQKMSNKEIANVLNVSPAAVEKAKYRLKKKIGLRREISLDEFIQKL
jgi:DNA-binding CsgD family transcriptional regulator